MDEDQDDLDVFIAERSARDPEFAALYQAAHRRQELLRTLALLRSNAGLSQAALAERMGTSPAVVERLERGDMSMELATIERYATALGKKVEWQVVDA